MEADDASLRLSLGDGEVEIPFSEVRRAHALEDDGGGGMSGRAIVGAARAMGARAVEFVEGNDR